MRKIDKEQFKANVLRVLEEVGKPIWVSELHTKYGLPWCSLKSKRDCSTNKGIWELIKDRQIKVLMPKEYKLESRKVRKQIALPSDDPLRRSARRTFEYQLVMRIEELERKLKQPWYKRIFH